MLKNICSYWGIFLFVVMLITKPSFSQDIGNPDTCRVEQKGDVSPNQVVTLKVWAYNDETLGGFAIPLKFCTPPATIYCDSVSFVGSRTSGYSYSGITIDSAECRLVFYAVWTSGGLSSGNGLIATLYFKTTADFDPDIG